MEMSNGGINLNLKKELHVEQKHLDETVEKIKERTNFVEDFLERKKALVRTNNNLPGDIEAYEQAINEKGILEHAIKEPYFGRFDVYSEENGKETFYIGRQGVYDKDEKILVVDWRKPIASVYYNFAPGLPAQKYEVIDKDGKKTENKLNVLLKREFTIKNQRIKKMVQQVPKVGSELNATITDDGIIYGNITDEFLIEIIENSESNGFLKEIIPSIQREQNEIIRQPLNANVIIQGVAGSGKSSIALHRLSFLLYNNRHLKPENVLIIGPSQLFLSSFQSLLPKLNLEEIHQKTFIQLAEELLGKKIVNSNNLFIESFFEKVLFQKAYESGYKRIKFKGSQEFLMIIEHFLEELKIHYEKSLDNIRIVKILDEILTNEDLVKIYQGYSHLPFAQNVLKFQQKVERHFKDIKEKKINEVSDQYNTIVSYLANGGLTESEKEKVTTILKRVKNHKIKNIEKEYEAGILQFKKNTDLSDAVTIYKQILSYQVLSSFKDKLNPEIPSLFQNYKVNHITYFDIPAILYIYLSLNGSPLKYTHIIVDEAQDLSFIQFSILKKITKTMTILGDIEQSIYIGYGQESWKTLKDYLFNSNNDCILNMKISYRSTEHIINVANRVLYNFYGKDYQPIKALSRKGEEVSLEYFGTDQELIRKIKSTLKEWTKTYKRIAIIGKNKQDSEKLAKSLSFYYGNHVAYITPDDDIPEKTISIITSYNSKGMEFDAVMLADVNYENYPFDLYHAKLLYVLITRAQHKLKIFYRNSPSQLLDGLI